MPSGNEIFLQFFPYFSGVKTYRPLKLLCIDSTAESYKSFETYRLNGALCKKNCNVFSIKFVIIILINSLSILVHLARVEMQYWNSKVRPGTISDQFTAFQCTHRSQSGDCAPEIRSLGTLKGIEPIRDCTLPYSTDDGRASLSKIHGTWHHLHDHGMFLKSFPWHRLFSQWMPCHGLPTCVTIL